LSDLVKKKSKGRRIVAAPDEGAPSQGNVINLMDALRKSLKSADKQAEPKSAAPKKKARAK
jgi:non-homologous end joining protein Ku